MKNKEQLKDAIEFMTEMTRYLLKPDRPIYKDLDPTFYHTLSYEGEIKLINQFKEHEKIIKDYLNE